MQTKNLTIMFTDMKGFTTRTSVQSRKQVEFLLNLHDQIIRPVFAQFGGQVIKTIGDAFLVVFESPTDAVLCGMKIQETVINHNATAISEERFEVRVAINSREVHIKDSDVFGEPVNIAARIESIAEPNEVYFTESVYLTMNRNEIPSSEVGHRHLKGIPEQVKVYKVLQEKTNLVRAQMRRKDLAEKSGTLPKGVVIESTKDSSPTWFQRNKKTIITVLITILVLGLLSAINNANKNKQKNQEDRSLINKPVIDREISPVKPDQKMDENIKPQGEDNRELLTKIEEAVKNNDREQLKNILSSISAEAQDTCSPVVCLALARVYQVLGDEGKAIQFFEKALLNNPPPLIRDAALKMTIQVFRQYPSDVPMSMNIRRVLTTSNLAKDRRDFFMPFLNDKDHNLKMNVFYLFLENQIYPVDDLLNFYVNEIQNRPTSDEKTQLLSTLKEFPGDIQEQLVNGLYKMFEEKPEKHGEDLRILQNLFPR